MIYAVVLLNFFFSKWYECLLVAVLTTEITYGWLTGLAKSRAVFTSTWKSGEMCGRGEGKTSNRSVDYRFSNPMDEPHKRLQWKAVYWAKVFPSGWLTLWAWHDVLLVWGPVAWACLGGIEYRYVQYSWFLSSIWVFRIRFFRNFLVDTLIPPILLRSSLNETSQVRIQTGQTKVCVFL